MLLFFDTSHINCRGFSHKAKSSCEQLASFAELRLEPKTFTFTQSALLLLSGCSSPHPVFCSVDITPSRNTKVPSTRKSLSPIQIQIRLLPPNSEVIILLKICFQICSIFLYNIL